MNMNPIPSPLKLARKNILQMEPYTCARMEYTKKGGIFLDANENPFGVYNRYPDPLQTELKQRLGELKSVSPDSIFIGNGSDEIIDLLVRIFCEPSRDRVLTFSPTYGMYDVACRINDVELLTIPLNSEFQIDKEAYLEKIKNPSFKMVIACSPNNPTGNVLDHLELIAGSFPGIVVIDEAYNDFSQAPSYVALTKQYPNLVVLQTFSKAWGLAGARVGMAFAGDEIIGLLNKVKAPYNVSSLNQQAALDALKDIEGFQKRKELICAEREYMTRQLAKAPGIIKVFPSQTNFLLVEADDAEQLYHYLLSKNLITRNRSRLIPGCLRITVGSPLENRLLLQALGVEESLPVRRVAQIRRHTSETTIQVELDLDGTGQGRISTGIPFFDHMLEQVARHGNIDLTVQASGDLRKTANGEYRTDSHHLIEDVGLCLGEAFRKSLGDKAGIERYGFTLPMDDSLAQAAIDFGGRPQMVWNAEYRREFIGEMPAEMLPHFFKSFCDMAQCNLNIRAEGQNEHHKAEATFKAFARALRMAAARTGSSVIPSTKGTL